MEPSAVMFRLMNADVLVYIGDMAQSLAQMAQQVGHHSLSEHLYNAAQKARANL